MIAQDELQADVAGALADDLDRHFERMVLAYQHRVYGFAINLVGDRFTAEEIAQETFVAAYQALSRYDPERRRALSIRAWLYTIALNRVRNRSRRRSSLPLEEAVGAARADPRDEPPRHAERLETRAELRAALGRLSLRYRVPVVLRHVEGRSYREIADMLGQPPGTVKANVHRGLAALRTDLESRNQHAH